MLGGNGSEMEVTFPEVNATADSSMARWSKYPEQLRQRACPDGGRVAPQHESEWAAITAVAGKLAQHIAVATRRAHEFYRAIRYSESATYYKKDLR